MYYLQKEKTHITHTTISRYLLEKILQQVDFTELISNRHKTTNGFILVKEIKNLSALTIERSKTVHRLREVILESKSKKLITSLKNDRIIKKYCKDIIQYFESIDIKALNENNFTLISEIKNKSEIHYIRLYIDYLKLLKIEFLSIDLDSTQEAREIEKIDEIVQCFIPFLLEEGYSPQNIFHLCIKLIQKPKKNLVELFFRLFSGEQHAKTFAIRTQSEVPNPFIQHLERKKIIYCRVNLLEANKPVEINQNEEILIFSKTTTDPFTFLRQMYDDSLKNHVSSKDRKSLNLFINYFDSLYFKEKQHTRFQKALFGVDPLNVSARRNTLHNTLNKCSKYYKFDNTVEDNLPNINAIFDSVYFYNLALGSKSIENSIFLLWTSLESLIPYRIKGSDIENVCYFSSKFLSIGSIGRKIFSFLQRLENIKKYVPELKESSLIPNFDNIYDSNNVLKAFRWLLESPEAGNDPFNLINSSSPLLAKQYLEINSNWSKEKISLFSDIINHSSESVKYQLDRIYLYRNRVVHSAYVINEYSNLWHHLEWYVGKLLSYCFILNLKIENPDVEFDRKFAFMQLEGNIDTLLNQLKESQDRSIVDSPQIIAMLCEHLWLFF
ncbi:hypothetical protein [Leptospira perdikensis]|uniref:Apea-like HEPN domain-containing protein n=1 Tax=Leptospira perdikensis TaxID=2484948 RepID=A0A4V3JPQ8_9LEPT|nr:hypothetical protein [Leptospira perdikensis]TGL45972.1 hypothetical protein EHQ49_00880 [Leptospira perdikensis]